MKLFKTFLQFAMATIVCSCEQKEEHKLITPLPREINVENMRDCKARASFTVDNFNWDARTLRMTVYGVDVYRIADVAGIRMGDTVMINTKPRVIEKIDTVGEGRLKGQVRYNDIYCFWPTVGYNLAEAACETCYAGYTECPAHVFKELGMVEVPLAEGFELIDGYPSLVTSILTEEETQQITADTIRTDHRQYLESLDGSLKAFHGDREVWDGRTLVTIKDGKITQIHRL